MKNDFKFASTDTQAFVAAMIAAYENITGITLQPASPERLMILWAASALVQSNALINDKANQNIPSRARGNNLDALAEIFYDKTRPPAQAATCTVRFTISAVSDTATLIPSGTRVTDTSSKLFWKTNEDIYIAAGELSADTQVECMTTGVVGNGWAEGQLCVLVDIFPYYQSVVNITASDGGADEATDAEFLELMRASEDAYTTAGPMGAYIYWAKSVSTDIADVVALRPKEALTAELTVYAKHAFYGGTDLDPSTLKVYPHGSATEATQGTDYSKTYSNGLLTIELIQGGALYSAASIDIEVTDVMGGYVNIYALMNDGSIASQTIKELIEAACGDDDVRPLTDRVSVEDPLTVSYNIDLTYYTARGSEKSATEIREAVNAAVEKYVAWQCARLGRDINPSKLISLLMETGIKRIALTAPVFTVIKDGSDNTAPAVAAVGTISVTDGGYEDE